MDLKKLRIQRLEKANESHYIRPYTLKMTVDGEEKSYNITRGHDSVSIVLYHTEVRRVLLVRQFRPAVFTTDVLSRRENILKTWDQVDISKYEIDTGTPLELCAGLVDKANLDRVEIAREEILEECGYSVDKRDIHHINTFCTKPRTTGQRHDLFFAEINESMKKTEGGGSAKDGEMISKVWLTFDQMHEMIFSMDDVIPAEATYGLFWFYTQETLQLRIEDEYKFVPEHIPELKNFSLEKGCEDGALSPIRMLFEQDGKPRMWDMLLNPDFVSILVFDTKAKELIVLQKFRPARLVALASSGKSDSDKELNIGAIDPVNAFTLELFNVALNETEDPFVKAKSSIEARLGKRVSEAMLVKIIQNGISTSGERCYSFYAELDGRDVDGVAQDPSLNLIRIPLLKAKSFLHPNNRRCQANLLFMILWFIEKRMLAFL